MESSNSGGWSCSMLENNFLDSQQPYTKTYNFIRWKSGKRVDPRLLTLLESFEEIYVDRRDFFRKIFHENHEELFKKIGDALKKRKQMKKARSMGRSTSMNMRATGRRGLDDDDEIGGLRLQRFKVKTPNVIIEGQDDTNQEGQTQPTQGSSKDSK